ncbi:hypothetical protein ACQ4LE_003378 [Meloidogyne hapla]|uniref:K Homology domain-containing protein n=1 Tax=Meloidogyne hapla TaxID=6305 RepID=A0A1I8BFS0_MELHA
MLINNQQQQSLPQSPPPNQTTTNFEGNNFINLNSQPIPLFGGFGNCQQQQTNNLFNSGGGIFSTTNVFQQNQNLNKTIIQNQENGCGGGGIVDVGQRQINGQTIPGAWFFPPQQSAELDTNTLGSPCSPGLMAPQQLLARFGPRHSTDSVEVPSSEHVAEIVGRQGCKIKALRAKTNTYIKTPVRGEEPVFVVTGRHEDVAEARREIECAAEHFTQIRASRRHSQGACPAPGHVTAYVRVPLRVVGLVVGPKGNTIKRIQQDTHTYIITPSREREPIFEVTGLPENVEAARREIENHIYHRTGNMPITDPNASIANFDLNSAALQAQQAALQSTSVNRPNYGALAVVCPRNLSLLNGGGGKDSSPYFQQHQNGINSNHFGNGYGQQTQNEIDHYLNNNNYNNNLNSKSGMSVIFNGNNINCCPPPSADLHNSTTSNSAASSNDLHLFFNSLELDGPINGGNGSVKFSSFGAIGDPHPAPDNQKRQEQQQPHNLFRSVSNELRGQQQFEQFGSTFSNGGSAFSPWTTTTIGAVTELTNGVAKENATTNGVDLFELFSSTSSSSPLAFSFSNGTKCY